jgi:site-specific recombinase XerD
MPKEAPAKVRGVYEKPVGSGVWWIQFFAHGKRHREKVGRRSAAIALYQKRRTEIREGVKMPESMRASRVILFREFVQDALVYSEAHKRTVRQDRSYWRSLEPVFGNLPADTISPALIEEYFKRRTDLKPATINRLRSFLSMVFQQAIGNGKAEKNPARLVRLRKEANARIRFLTFEEEDLIRAIILERTPTHEPAFTFALETGMRLSEQHTMTWDQVNLGRRQVFLDRTKNGESRVVVLSADAIDALGAVQARRRELENKDGWVPTDRVWLSRYGEPLDSPVAWFKLVMQDARRKSAALKDVTWHVFRHTYISRLVMAGVDIRTVQELAGHKSISMTVRYSHLSPDHKLSAVAMLAEFRKRNSAG